MDIVISVNTDPFLLFFGSFYMVLGLSCFFAKEHWEDFIKLFVENDTLSLVMGIFLLPISLFIIVFYDNWETLASIVLMVMGYMGFLKSLVLLLRPKMFQKMLSKRFVQKWLWLDGLSGIAIGAAMVLL
ncbi:MAG: hypothetical protein AAF204_04675 [Pseudomonadota bacterium]